MLLKLKKASKTMLRKFFCIPLLPRIWEYSIWYPPQWVIWKI